MGKSIHSFTISMHCQDDDDDARPHDKESQGPPPPLLAVISEANPWIFRSAT